jgi:NADH-quinone oxidoreductase subunit J
VVIGGWKYKGTFIPLSDININVDLSNTHALGNILYTDYIHLFQIAGMILLVAMVGAITLTFSKRENIKRQNYFEQIQREKTSAVSLVDVKSGKGVKLDD